MYTRIQCSSASIGQLGLIDSFLGLRVLTFMTFVNMKKVEELVERRIMVLISANESRGLQIRLVRNYFYPNPVQAIILDSDVPGWTHLSGNKREGRLNKVIWRLIKAGRARIERSDGTIVDKAKPYQPQLEPGDRLVPLNALDRIVFGLAQEEDSGSA